MEDFWMWAEEWALRFVHSNVTKQWVGRVLVTIAIVISLDLHAAYVKRKKLQQHEQQAAEESQDGKLLPEKVDGTIQIRNTETMKDKPTELSRTAGIRKEEIKSDSLVTNKKSPSSPREPHSGSIGKEVSKKSATNGKLEAHTSPAKDLSGPPKMKATSNDHPGMEGFSHWYDVETSLYRIYTLTYRDPSIQTIPPYMPKSSRGNVPIELLVTNRTNRNINVFWVDYTGKYILKGTIGSKGGVWRQETWIDHPWVFEDAENSTIYLHYVPYRVIPSIPSAPTVGFNDTDALHRFALINDEDGTRFHIGVEDEIMPFPGITHFQIPLHAINWTLKHMSRAIAANMTNTNSIFLEIDTLQKYLTNILRHPDRVKYRQLRIASPRFRSIWASHLKGVLLAVGFVESGGYAELGCPDYPLSSERLQDVALLSYLLNRWKGEESNPSLRRHPQPQGASDGYGRAGFGRAGQMS